MMEELITELGKTFDQVNLRLQPHPREHIDSNTRLIVAAILMLIKTLKEKEDGKNNT
jgi:hypothetical protein